MDSGLVRVLRWFLVVFCVFLILAIIILAIFRPSPSVDTTKPNEQTPQSMSQLYANSQMRFIQTGQVTAPENHFQVNINIDSTSRTMYIYNGYGVEPKTTKSYANNQESFNAFLGALEGAGFNRSKGQNRNISFDTFCTLGIRFNYQIFQDQNLVQNTWNSSCNPKEGTFAGTSNLVRQLFIQQIPDYNSLMNGVRL